MPKHNVQSVTIELPAVGAHTLKPAVLLVAGRVADKHLRGPRFGMLDDYMSPKLVHLSRQQFVGDFVELLDRHGIENLGEAQPGPRAQWRSALASVQGAVGAVVIDDQIWRRLKGKRSLFGSVPTWLLFEGECKLVPPVKY
jgi:hypothetical protein